MVAVSPVPAYTASAAPASVPNGVYSRYLPRSQGSSAKGITAPVSSAESAPRRLCIVQLMFFMRISRQANR